MKYCACLIVLQEKGLLLLSKFWFFSLQILARLELFMQSYNFILRYTFMDLYSSATLDTLKGECIVK